MAQQYVHQVRPFVAKQTFDQVSAVMWGQNAFDYHTNYIVPRANWTDSDIREEALYFSGLAHGLRLGAAQKPSQPLMHQGSYQDQPRVFINGNHYQPLNYGQQGHPAFGKHGVVNAAVQPRPSHRPDMLFSHRAPPPEQNVMENSYRPAPPQHASWGTYESAPQHDTYADLSSYYKDSNYPENDSNIFSLFPPSRPNARLPVQESISPKTATGSAGAQTVAGSAAAKSEDQEISEPFGILSIPDGRTLSVPLTEDWASPSHAEMSLDHLISQPRAVVHNASNTLTPTVEDQPEESSDEDYGRTSTPLSEDHNSENDALDESMEKWFEEQAARDV